jgi:hypothetical protein
LLDPEQVKVLRAGVRCQAKVSDFRIFDHFMTLHQQPLLKLDVHSAFAALIGATAVGSHGKAEAEGE